jgi:hypothetical protein
MMRSFIGMAVGAVMFLVSVAETFLLILHYLDLIEHWFPESWHSMFSLRGIFILMALGILVMVIAWVDYKHNSQRHHAISLSPSIPTAENVNNNSLKANPSFTANPTIDASQKVEIHNHPPFATPTHAPSAPFPVPSPHNIQFMGIKKIKTDVAREVLVPAEGFVGVKACFLNKSIPGTKIRDFDYVRARIVLRNASGEEVAEIDKPKWLGYEPGDAVHIHVNQTRCILLAVFGTNSEWVTPFISTMLPIIGMMGHTC